MALGCDVLVIGGGSAGSVLARRLSDDPAVRVILVEAGPAAESLMVRMPAGFAYAKKAGRREYVRVSLDDDGVARKFARDGAGVIASLTETDGLAVLPEEMTRLAPGERIDFLSYRALL